MYFYVFWRTAYAQKYKLCISASKWQVLLAREDWADYCSLCFLGFACKLADPLVNGIKINVNSIIVFVLVFELHVNVLHLWISLWIQMILSAIWSKEIEDITRWREDMNFMFKWQEQLLCKVWWWMDLLSAANIFLKLRDDLTVSARRKRLI